MRFSSDFEFVKLPKHSKAAAHSWNDAKDIGPDGVRKLLRAGLNYGVRLKQHQLVIDVDKRNGGSLALFNFDTTDFPTVLTPSNGFHIYVTLPPGVDIRKTVKDKYPGVDFISIGGYVVGPGSVLFPNGPKYEWDDFSATTFPPKEIPAELLADIQRSPIDANELEGLVEADLWTLEQLEEVLGRINIEEFRDHDTWFAFMCACHEATGGLGKEAFKRLSLSDPKYAEHSKIIDKRWDSLRAGKAGNAGAGTLRRILLEHGVEPPNVGVDLTAEFAEVIRDNPHPKIPHEPNLLKYPRNDYGNQLRFEALHKDRARYCHGKKKWLIYDGKRWGWDYNERIREDAKKAFLVCYRQAIEAKDADATKHAHASLKNDAISSMLGMLRSSLTISLDELDSDPYLLNVRNGTLDLRTGTLKPHDPADWITKLVDDDFRPEAKAPTFEGFLKRILPERLIDYVQRAMGYSATGITSEKAIFFPWGGGDNGKSTFLEIFRLLLSDYSTQISINSIMHQQRGVDNNVLADLADLRGVRFATTSETERSQGLAEAQLKRLSQGTGKVKAVKKYEDWIQFREEHKLWCDANHRPTVQGVDEAIWNRLRLIPFEAVIPKSEQKRDFARTLISTEAEGILAWLVAGAMRWHREGLGLPPEVQAAVATWRQESDPLKEFFDKHCEFTSNGTCTVSSMNDAFETWCLFEGEPEGKPDLKGCLEAKGAVQDRVGKDRTRVWRHVRLISQ